MNFADIENTWRSEVNRPSIAQLEQLKTDLSDELQRRRRASRGLLWLTAVPLVLVTARLFLQLVWPDPALDRLDFAREWMVVPFFFLPWAGWLLIWRQHRRHEADHREYDRSIQAGMAALLDQNRREGLRSRVVVAMLLLSLPLVGGVVWQLRAVGKMGDEVLIPAFVIYPAYVVLMVGWIGWEYARKTVRRRKELEGVLSDYQRTA